MKTMSCREIAKRTGWSHAQIANIMSGRNKPSLDSLRAIASALRLRPDQVLELRGKIGRLKRGCKAQIPYGEAAFSAFVSRGTPDTETQ